MGQYSKPVLDSKIGFCIVNLKIEVGVLVPCMSKGYRIALLLLFLLLLAFLIFYAIVALDLFGQKKNKAILNAPANATLSAPTVSFIDPKRGNPRGTVMLVEFGDYLCGYCKEMEGALNAALRAHPNLRLVWKDLPNKTLHPESLTGALAARCALRQGKFWEYHDALFEQADTLAATSYPQIADKLGLNVGKFTACLTNKEESAIIERNIEEATALGVDGTPYFFLQGLRISGSVSPEEFAALLNQVDPV
ncbi:hypothetical protein EPN90_04665, partial [Patescibacteria group bacterium]